MLPRLRKNNCGILETVILRPLFGRRISRNESDLIAASWLFHEDLRRNAATRHVGSNHCGDPFDKFRAKDGPQDDSGRVDRMLSHSIFRSLLSRAANEQ